MQKKKKKRTPTHRPTVNKGYRSTEPTQVHLLVSEHRHTNAHTLTHSGQPLCKTSQNRADEHKDILEKKKEAKNVIE